MRMRSLQPGARLRSMARSSRLRTAEQRSAGRAGLSRAVPDLVELGFVLILVTGVGAIFWPAALILFGLLGVVACERRSAVRVKAQRSPGRAA